MHKHQALIEKINVQAAAARPFFLLVDFMAECPVLFSPEDLEKEHILVDFPNWKNTVDREVDSDPVTLEKHEIGFANYLEQYQKVHAHLLYGNSFLTNLTAATPVETSASLADIFAASKAKYKIRFRDEWVCFSPETFIRIENKRISTFPMKGTIDAALPDAAAQLLNDPKETAEHYTIVDLLRNDLSMVATNVSVKKFRYLDTIHTRHKTLLQASSQIEGRLPADFREHLGEIIFTLLPAGSISGAPKKKTLEIIREAETYDRGFYTGTAFYYDGRNLDSCVLIRFIEKTPGGFVYKSGGGITIHSQPEKEYRELLDKIYVPAV